jgi:hypothetical protein
MNGHFVSLECYVFVDGSRIRFAALKPGQMEEDIKLDKKYQLGGCTVEVYSVACSYFEFMTGEYIAAGAPRRLA